MPHSLTHSLNTNCALELLENKPFSKSVDTYAFGVLMWEMFTGEIPFYMIDIRDITERVISGQRPRMPSYGIPAKLVTLINKCWHQNPTERPDFTSIVDLLLEVVDEMPDSTYTDSLVGTGDALDDFLKK